MSVYSSELAVRLRGKITNDVDTVPLSEAVAGAISASDSRVGKIVVTGTDAELDSIRKGDYILIKELKEVRYIKGISGNTGDSSRIIYTDPFSSTPTADDPIYICRIASSGLNRPTRITIHNDGAVDVIVDNNPDGTIVPSDYYTMFGDNKTMVPVALDVTGGSIRFSDGIIQNDSTVVSLPDPMPPRLPSPNITSVGNLTLWKRTTGDVVFQEKIYAEDSSLLLEQWYEVSGGSLAPVAVPTDLEEDWDFATNTTLQVIQGILDKINQQAKHTPTGSGKQKITVSTIAQTLTVPVGAVGCVISVEDAPVRVAFGTSPTATDGILIEAGDLIELGEIAGKSAQEMTDFTVIRKDGTDAILNVEYYNAAP
jgi:hypothetical protein